MTDCLVVLAKEPRRGEAKTRLARDVGLDRAQRLAEAFVLDTLALARARTGTDTLVAFAPAGAAGWFERTAPWAGRWPQPEGGFGHRIRSAVRAALERGATRCVVIGMDTPHLRPELLDQAFAALEVADVCLGPSVDGGYYLIGLDADRARLFEDVPWSTDAVHRVTLERARECGLRVHELAVEFDVDEGGDLELLAHALRAHPTCAPATRAILFANPAELSGDGP